MDSSESIGVYGEAKAEYTRQLCNFLVPALETYFLDLLKDTKETEKDPKRILWVFQDALKQFPDWNMDKVQRETAKIVEHTKCDYLEEILTAVFIAHTKVLSAIRLTSKQKKLQITIPKLEHFLHRTMSECARLLWSNAYLFNDNISSIERQKNLRQVEQLLNEGVLQSIRGMLPVKSILKEYLSDEGVDMGASAAVEEGEGEEETPAEPAVEPVVKEEAAEVKEETPVVTGPPAPSVLPSLIVDLSGVSVKEGMKEEVKEEIKEEVKEEKKEEPKPPMIHVDTEPVVSFTDMDTIFHHNPIKNMIGPSDQKEDEAYVDGIEIDESAPAEEVDDFETLDKEEEDELAFAENEFETL
jgi:hypothetical protein